MKVDNHEKNTAFILTLQQLAPLHREQLSFWCRFVTCGYPTLDLRISDSSESKQGESILLEIVPNRSKSAISSARQRDSKHTISRQAARDPKAWQKRKIQNAFLGQQLSSALDTFTNGLIRIHQEFMIAPIHTTSLEDPTNPDLQMRVIFPPTRTPNDFNQVIPLVQIRESCSELLESIRPGAPDLALMIKQALHPIPLNWQSVEMANLLGISHRSLQRQLQQKGTSFSDIQQQELLRLTISGLQNPQVPITELSEQLGFNNVSNFGRLCRRHFGHSPKALRKELLKLD